MDLSRKVFAVKNKASVKEYAIFLFLFLFMSHGSFCILQPFLLLHFRIPQLVIVGAVFQDARAHFVILWAEDVVLRIVGRSLDAC